VGTLGRVGRWTADEVLALAPDHASAHAARALAVPSTWSAIGADDRGLWGLCLGRGHEPYHAVVDRHGPAYRCSCPSRKHPCKHVLALLLLWSDGLVAEVARPGYAAEWLAERAEREARRARAAERPSGVATRTGPPRASSPPPSGRRERREARVQAGLDELDRWLADQVRGGLTAPHLARYAAWDAVAARLVDAQAGSLANRVRRVGARVGVGAGWHERVLEELSIVHVLAVAGRRLGQLDDDDAATVRQGLGLTVGRDEVLEGVPLTDRWVVAGCSDADEDRIVVRRTWLWGTGTRRWVMVLAFAALGQGLDDGLVVGTTFVADLHPYPGALALRALVGTVHEAPVPCSAGPAAGSLDDALAARAAALAREPWLERWPACVTASPRPLGRGWCLADEGGALPVVEPFGGLAPLVAATRGEPAPITVELHAEGVLPLAVHLPGRTVTW